MIYAMQALILALVLVSATAEVWTLKTSGYKYFGDAHNDRKVVFLNELEPWSAGAVSTAPAVSDILNLDENEFSLTAKVGFTEYETCPGAAFLFSFGGSLNCLKKGKLVQCKGINLLVDQDGLFAEDPAVYLVKDGELYDQYSGSFDPKGVYDMEVKVEVIDEKTRGMSFYFDGNDIFHKKQSKGYDVAYSMNDLKEGMKFLAAGVTDDECLGMHRIKSIAIDVDQEVTSEEKKELKKYAKPSSLESLPSLIADVGESFAGGEFQFWMPFTGGMMLAALAAVAARKFKKSKDTSYQDL